MKSVTFSVCVALLTLSAVAEGTVRKKGVFMNSVLVMGPDAHVSLYNESDEEIDLSGWSLNHENTGAKKGDWTFPDGTTLAPGESLVLANSAAEYRKARGKNPDLEIGVGDGIKDDDSVANVVSADGAGVIRSSDDEDGALVLRDAKGALKGHMGFRPDPPAHVVQEQAKWNEIPTAAELAGLDGAPKAAADGGRAEPEVPADDPGAAAQKPQGAEAVDTDAVKEKLAALEAQQVPAPATESGAAPPPQDQAVSAETSSAWLWISAVLALLIGGFFWFRRPG